MSNVYNITRNEDGQFEMSDTAGKLVEGPFETNAAAWKALDRLDAESYTGLDRKRKPRKTKGKAKNGKGYNPPKPSKAKEDRQMKREAAKAPTWIRDIAAVKFDPQANRAYRDYKLGTLGPASEVRRIDPAIYLAEKAAREDRA